MEVTTIGIDLAKSVFAVSGADSRGRVVIRRQIAARAAAGVHARAAALRGGDGGNGWRAILGAPVHRAGA
jgi:hypothetical protein